MKLDRLILVNWGQLRPGDYELANMTLLTGPTGAGKSTMLDGLQTVMTAEYQGIVSYNPGQEEVSQNERRGKVKRTLESFVVGAEYSRFSRPDGAQGYMAAVFRPSQGEQGARTFTAVVAAAARVDRVGEAAQPKLERMELVIVEDAALSSEDFLANAERSEWVPVEEIVRRLKAKYPGVQTFDGRKKDYLCALYGRFRGRTSVTWDEAQHAAKAWTQSIAHKKIGSVHELVRDDVLEFDGRQLEESIGRISDLMKNVAELRRQGERIAATVARLDTLKTAIDGAAASYEKQVKFDLLLANLHIADAEARVGEKRLQIQQHRDLAEREERRANTESELRRGADKSRVEVAARLSGVPAYAEKERVEESLRQAEAAARITLERLTQALLMAARLDDAGRVLIAMAVPEQFTRVRAAVAGVAQALTAPGLERLGRLKSEILDAVSGSELVASKLAQLPSSFHGANAALAALHAGLVGPSDSVATAIAAEEAAVDTKLEELRARARELAGKKQRLETGAGNYDRETDLAVRTIRELLPQTNVEVLCDLVEPASEEWQSAIEAYLGNARFNLIVHPDWEARTIDLLQGRRSRAKVIQGRRCLAKADETRVPVDSIIHELRAAHPIAKAYLIEQYGPVVKVGSSEELRMTARGLTKDGKGSGSRTMFVLDRQELVFGRAARERALVQVIEQLGAVERERAGLQEAKLYLEQRRRQLRDLREPVLEAGDLAKVAADIEHARRTLSQLDLTEVKDLERRLRELEQKVEHHQAEVDRAKAAVVQADERIVQAEAEIRRIQDRTDERLQERERQIQRLKNLCAANAQHTYTVLSDQVRALAETMDIAGVSSQLEILRTEPLNLLGSVRDLLADFNANARQDERFQADLYSEESRFDPIYPALVKLGRAVATQLNDLKGAGVYRNAAELARTEASFKDVFTKQFCIEIKSKVEDGVRTLRQLNTELERLKFGSDRFRIDWSRWEPEFEEYYRFFCAAAELADNPESTDLFAETSLSPKHAQVRDKLVDLLLDTDHERARRELLRVADYRNYRRYEIWNRSDSGGEVALSTWGTGSGGQLQTPAYVVRAAVVTNRLKLFEKGPSLKLLVSDESFDKMDDTRAVAVLRFLSTNLGLQVVCAMPTRTVGPLRPEFEKEYSYTRVFVPENGQLDFIIEYDVRDYKQDSMRQLWARQREQAREQARLEFEAREAHGQSAQPVASAAQEVLAK